MWSFFIVILKTQKQDGMDKWMENWPILGPQRQIRSIGRENDELRHAAF